MKNLFKKSSAISIATAMLASMTLSPLASFAESGVDGPYSIQVNPYYGTSSGVPGDGYTPPGEGTSADTAARTFIIEEVDSTGAPLISGGYTNKLSGTGSILFDKLDEGYYKIYPEYTGDAASLTGINSFIVQLPMTNSTGGTLKPVNVYPKDLFPEDDPDDPQKPDPEDPEDPDDPDDPDDPIDPSDPTDPDLPDDENFDSSVTLKKRNESGAPIEGAKFKLYYDNDGNYMPVGNGKEYESNGADGDIVITDLPYGTYYFIETEAASGYLLEQTPIPFTISAADPHVEIIKENEAAPTVTKIFDRVEGGNYYWTIKAELPDNPSSLLTYTINDIKGAGLDTISIESVTSNGATALAESDYTIVNGKISLTESGLGKLTDATSITVVVKSTLATDTALSDVTNNASIEYTYDPYIPPTTPDPNPALPDIIDPPTDTPPTGGDTTDGDPSTTKEVQQVIINVIDGTNAIDADKTARFEIQDAAGNALMTDVKNGDEVTLPLGEGYKLVQTKAPDGYKFEEEPVTFAVIKDATDDPDNDGDTEIKVDFTNTKNAFDLPFTGTISTIIFFAGGICLMAIAGLFIFIIIKKKKEEEEEEQTN